MERLEAPVVGLNAEKRGSAAVSFFANLFAETLTEYGNVF